MLLLLLCALLKIWNSSFKGSCIRLMALECEGFLDCTVTVCSLSGGSFLAPQAGLSHTVLVAPRMGALGCGMSSLPALGTGPEGGGSISLRCFLLTRSHCYRCAYGDSPVLQQSGEMSCGNIVRLSLLLSLCIFPKCPLPATTGKRDLVGCLCASSAEEGQGIYGIYSIAARHCPDPPTPNNSVPVSSQKLFQKPWES